MTENGPTGAVVALTLALVVGLAAFLTHPRRIIERVMGWGRDRTAAGWHARLRW